MEIVFSGSENVDRFFSRTVKQHDPGLWVDEGGQVACFCHEDGIQDREFKAILKQNKETYGSIKVDKILFRFFSKLKRSVETPILVCLFLN